MAIAAVEAAVVARKRRRVRRLLGIGGSPFSGGELERAMMG
jgi:hypothetical protein